MKPLKLLECAAAAALSMRIRSHLDKSISCGCNLIQSGAAAPHSKFVGCLALAVALAICAGCQNVKPWQRGTLADVTMRADRDPIGIAMDEHIFFSREGASGGRGVGGGGCGCN